MASFATKFLAAVLSSAALVRAQVDTQCQGSVCYGVHVPQSAASSGSGDIYFQIRAPSSYSWAALGQGSQMQGSNIFVIYADTSNNNVTLSPRLGTGEVQPQYDGEAKATLLAGSGITGGTMIANVLCSNCGSWNGGNMSFNDPQSGWIWAWKQGDPISSDSQSANLEQHDNTGTLTFDLGKSTGGTDSTNPFLGMASSTNSTISSAPSSAPSSDPSGGEQGPPPYYDSMQIAHGSLLGVCMVLLMPLGASLRRIAPNSSIWLHAIWQTCSWAIAIAGMGIGIWMALQTDQLITTHAYIGLVVVSTMSLQPVMGLLQHAHFRRTGIRGTWGWAHKVFGVAVILFGILNGGLGLQLSDNSPAAMMAYAVIASGFGIGWLAIIAMNATSNRKRS